MSRPSPTLRATPANGADQVRAAARHAAAAPHDPRRWERLACAFVELGRLDDAVTACLHGLDHAPGDGRLAVRLADCRLRAGAVREAYATAHAALGRSDLDAAALTRLGGVLTACERHDLARRAFSRAATLAPEDRQTRFNLATNARARGELAEAEQLYDAVIAAAPHDAEALKNRSDLRRQTPARNHIAELRTALATAPANPMLHAALAKELEDLDEDADAFTHYAAAARLRRAQFQYDVAEDLGRLREIAVANDGRRRAPGHPTDVPIFILGLPRTGSTLLDRLLGGLAGVVSAGELQNFAIQTHRLARDAQIRSAPAHGGLIATAARLEPVDLGRAYMESLPPWLAQARRFIDKMPTNALYVGLIASALPGAAIVHVRRSPMDACFAIYKAQFRDAYPWSYSFEEIAAYYAGHRRLMAHWRQILGRRIIDVDYEALVADPEGVLRPLCAALDIDFDPACLDLARNRAPVNTASAAQVRGAIYDSSVGRWRRFADQLEPLARALRAQGVAAD